MGLTEMVQMLAVMRQLVERLPDPGYPPARSFPVGSCCAPRCALGPLDHILTGGSALQVPDVTGAWLRLRGGQPVAEGS